MDTPPQQRTRPRGVPPRVSDPVAQLTFHDPRWTFPSTCGAGSGTCGIRVFVTDEGEVLAVLEEKGIGATVSNSTETLIPYLLWNLDLQPERVTVLEHWTDEQSGPGEGHLVQVELRSGTPHWLIVWPADRIHPQRQELETWFREVGTHLFPDLPVDVD